MEVPAGLGCRAEPQRVEVSLIGRDTVKARMEAAAIVKVEIEPIDVLASDTLS